MGLYSPVVAPDARPPINFPPNLSSAKVASGAATMAIGTAMALALPFKSDFRALIWLTIMEVTCYAVVSRVFLGRKQWLGSRYSSRQVSREFVKLLLVTPAIHYVVTRHTFAIVNVDETRAVAFLTVYAIGMHIGCYFCFLDNFDLLQSFGCKIVREKGWQTLSFAEATLGLGLLTIMVGLASKQASFWLIAPRNQVFEVTVVYSVACATLWLGRRIWPKAELHVHHYVTFFAVLPLTRYDALVAGSSPWSALLQSFCLGSAIEGVACWGMDPVLHDPRQRGSCKATELWTNFILAMNPRRDIWIRTLFALNEMYVTIEPRAPSLLHGEPRLLNSFRTQERNLTISIRSLQVDHREQLEKNCKRGEAFENLIRSLSIARSKGHASASDLTALAFCTCVVHGLQLGSPELESMAPTLLCLSDLERGALAIFTHDSDTLHEDLAEDKWSVKRLKARLTPEQQQELFMQECRIVDCLVDVCQS